MTNKQKFDRHFIDPEEIQHVKDQSNAYMMIALGILIVFCAVVYKVVSLMEVLI